MNLSLFAETMSRLMQQAHCSRGELAKSLNVSVAQIDRWKYGKRPPKPENIVALIRAFKSFLTLPEAQTWAAQVDYRLTPTELRQLFPPFTIFPPPVPNRAITIRRLPLFVERLFGITEAKTELLMRLNIMDDHWLLAIVGLGGLGKTTLANLLAHELLSSPRFYDVVWLSAKQEEFSPQLGRYLTHHPPLTKENWVDTLLQQLAPNLSLTLSAQEKIILLTHWLKQQPYLIVIDNLETVADYHELLTSLSQLANPSKFLLTSRESLSDYSQVYSYNLLPLTREETFNLLWYAGDTRDVPALRDATHEQLEAIYQGVGGNPLVLNLIIRKLRCASIIKVLAQLKQAEGKKITELYAHIYGELWHRLDDSTRRVLRIMGVLGSGTSEDIIDLDDHLSLLTELELQRTLGHLMHFSLVERRGTLEMPIYTIHSVTKTFLLQKISVYKIT